MAAERVQHKKSLSMLHFTSALVPMQFASLILQEEDNAAQQRHRVEDPQYQEM